MSKNAINSEKEIATKKRWRTSTLSIFIFFISIQIASLFVNAVIMICLYILITCIGPFANKLIYTHRINIDNDIDSLVFPELFSVLIPYIGYNFVVAHACFFISLPILFFIPYYIELEMSDKYLDSFFNIFTIVFFVISLIYFVDALVYACGYHELVVVLEDIVDKYNLYQYFHSDWVS